MQSIGSGRKGSTNEQQRGREVQGGGTKSTGREVVGWEVGRVDGGVGQQVGGVDDVLGQYVGGVEDVLGQQVDGVEDELDEAGQ